MVKPEPNTRSKRSLPFAPPVNAKRLKNQHLTMCGSQFTIGQGRQCDLWLDDPAVSDVLCKLRHVEHGGSSIVLLEIIGDKGAVKVNGRNCKNTSHVFLRGGDEVIVDKNAYILQQLTNNNVISRTTSVSVDADGWKGTGATYEIRPLFHMPSGSCPVYDGFSKILEQRELREHLKDVDAPTTLASSKRQAFKKSLQEGILKPDDIEVSFETFPYYISDTTKNILIASMYIHLKRNDFAKFVSDLPSMSPRILLSGPAGSEIYQETMSKALGKHFGARLLIVDSSTLSGVPLSEDADTFFLKESSRPERAFVLAKQSAHVGTVQHKKPTSSVDADIIGGSSLCFQVWLKQEISTASSKGPTLKTGDRVKFVGNCPADISSVQLARKKKLLAKRKKSSLQNYPSGGPSYGSKGEVLLPFEDNGSSKIGVRFDESIPDGNDLGGLCEDDRSFFCSANHLLRVDGSGGEDTDKLSNNEVFEVALEQSKLGAIILFLKDIEKAMSMSGNFEVLKSIFESLPQNLVAIGSHTQLGSREDKTQPGGLLIKESGGTRTELLEFGFPDNFSRLHDRSKETPKAMEPLSFLFPQQSVNTAAASGS